MYKYNDFDHAFITSRNAQFREQVKPPYLGRAQ